MLAGLNPDERHQLGLSGYGISDLCFLNAGDTRQDEAADAQRFAEWRQSLAVLGIPLMDVLRFAILSALIISSYPQLSAGKVFIFSLKVC